MAQNEKVKIHYSPTFDEVRHAEHGYTTDPMSDAELRSLAAPALADFKGESLQQARITVDGENSPLALTGPFDPKEFAEARALDALAEQRDRPRAGKFLGASNAHLQPVRRRV